MFDFPLSFAEAQRWAIGFTKSPKKQVGSKSGMLFLPGKEKYLKLRKERKVLSEEKLDKVFEILPLIKEIDTICAVFVTGSVAILNATPSSDIDLMIVTKPDSVWRTRFKLIRLLRKFNLERRGDNIKDRICTNIFLDSNHLEILERNIYTAHEILQAKCVFDRGGILKKWISSNKWTKEILPSAYMDNNSKLEEPSKNANSVLEILAFLGQYLYMRPKMTNEKVGLRFAFFHPRDGSKYYVSKFEKALKHRV